MNHHYCIIFSSCLVFLQASEDAKKLVDEERAFARAEIENAKAAVQRVEEALQEHERMSRASGKQVLLKFLLFQSHILSSSSSGYILCDPPSSFINHCLNQIYTDVLNH